ncbi:Guanylate cyclase D [Durusdinium trenchii]|uniref:Guanylate cyclase D n=1 Tax=Durusdinium trenchii TaxID=1381693 RepID=A0ABP0K375_9DINO
MGGGASTEGKGTKRGNAGVAYKASAEHGLEKGESKLGALPETRNSFLLPGAKVDATVEKAKRRRRSSISIVRDQQQGSGKGTDALRNTRFIVTRQTTTQRLLSDGTLDSADRAAAESEQCEDIYNELSEDDKVKVLKFSTEINLSVDMNSILEVVDRSFKSFFSDTNVVIHLNPEYAARYYRFLRKHSSQLKSRKRNKSLISRLEIGFEQYLVDICSENLSGSMKRRVADLSQALPKFRGSQAGSSVASEGEIISLGSPIFATVNAELNESMEDSKLKPMQPEIFPKTSDEDTAAKHHEIIAFCELQRIKQSEKGPLPYSTTDGALLAALCIHLGQALERACISSDLAKHLEWSRVMLRMSETLNSKLDAVVLIESAIAMLREALFAERGSMYIMDDSNDPPDLWTMVNGGEQKCEALSELRIPVGKGIAGHVAETGEVVIIKDAYKDERFNPSIDKKTGLKTTSILCVPVFDPETHNISAVIQMINKKDMDGTYTAAFDQDDVDILNTFSSHVSIALNNAKVTAQNQYNEKIANELLNKMFPKHITEKLKAHNQMSALLRDDMESNSRSEPLPSTGQSEATPLTTALIAQGSMSVLGTGGIGAARSASGVPAATKSSTVLAKPPRSEPIVEKYDRVFVFFSDIVSFTTLSMTWEPTEVVNLLNDLFTHMDYLSEKHHIYKLETIGDAYVACSNLPFMDQESERHAAENLARFAIDAVKFVDEFVTRNKKKIQIRCGIHCGSCFGGVVGLRMPRFCLMGDTMNTASRMESTGKPGRIHISEAFKQALECMDGASSTPFTSFPFEDLGVMDVKGKGEMRTYFLDPPPAS